MVENTYVYLLGYYYILCSWEQDMINETEGDLQKYFSKKRRTLEDEGSEFGLVSMKHERHVTANTAGRLLETSTVPKKRELAGNTQAEPSQA